MENKPDMTLAIVQRKSSGGLLFTKLEIGSNLTGTPKIMFEGEGRSLWTLAEILMAQRVVLANIKNAVLRIEKVDVDE